MIAITLDNPQALLLPVREVSEPVRPVPVYRVSRRLLLAVYAIVPISALIVLVDCVFLNGWIKMHLPSSPEDILIFVLFFGLSHCFASAATFLDADYLKRYGASLMPPAVIAIAVALFFPSVLYTKAFFAFFLTFRMVHFTGQQLGITRMLGRGFDRSFIVWKWAAMIISLPIYFGLFSFPKLSPEMHHAVNAGLLMGLVPFAYISYLVGRSVDTRIARYYVCANVALASAEVVFYTMGYFFFNVLISRVIHDLTAFAFYISHDANRNRETMKNAFYRSLRFSKIPVYALCPLAAMLFMFPLNYYNQIEWAYRIWAPLTIFHQYTDRFVWKKGSLHRDHIAMR